MYARSIHVQHSYSGWKIRLRSYSIRLFEETRAFSAAMLGDVSALQKLFGSGEASPYDRSETGRTLLHVSSLILPAREMEVSGTDATLLLRSVRRREWAARSSEVFYSIRGGYRCK